MTKPYLLNAKITSTLTLTLHYPKLILTSATIQNGRPTPQQLL